MLPRWLHRLYAKELGYFWLPCDVCGRYFGGHERRTYYGIAVAPQTSQGVCGRRACVQWADEYNATYWPGWKEGCLREEPTGISRSWF